MAGPRDPPFDDSSETELRPADEATLSSGPKTSSPASQVTLGRERTGPGTLPDLGLVTVPRDLYLVEGEIARGGMGRVLAARDRRLGRPVALKELLSSSPELARRFEREALMTARLQHPSIVNVHEAGRWPSGEPFYAMKRVVGRPLDQVVREAGSLEERLALLPKVLAVAEALAYAHEQGVIHRDLKPANVLVGSFGETVVVDWGLAKDLLREGAFDESQDKPAELAPDGLTVVGTVLGTPAYMAPEQARGERVDEQADVYALGAILYTVLAGRSPYVGPRSTAVLEEVLKGPPQPLEKLQPGLPEDLLALVRKAMAPRREDRYRTARELAGDLQRFQTGQLVGAHRYSTGQLVRRWVRRQRVPVTIATLASVILAATLVVSFRRIVRERRAAEQGRLEAQQARLEAEARGNDLVLSQARMLLDRDPTGALAWLKLYPTDAPRWGVARNIASDARRRGFATRVLGAHKSHVWAARFSPDGSKVVSGGMDKLVVVWDLRDGTSRTVSADTSGIRDVRFSPDGKWIASAGEQTVRLWSVAKTEEPGRLLLDTNRVPFCLEIAFSSRGEVLACAAYKGPIQVVDITTGRTVRLLGDAGESYRRVAFSLDGRSVAAQSASGVWLWRSGARRHFRKSTAFAFSPNGASVAVGQADGSIELWDAACTRARTVGRHSAASENQKAREVGALAFSRDSRHLASVGADRTVRVWGLDSASQQVVGTTQAAPDAVAFTRSGEGLLTLDPVQGLRAWALRTGEGAPGRPGYKPASSQILAGHANRIDSFDVSPDGARVVSAGEDGTVRLWDVSFDEPAALNAGSGLFSDVAFSPDGKLAASAWLSRWSPKGFAAARVWLWDWSADKRTELDGAPVLPWNAHAEMGTRALLFSPDSSRLAVLSQDGTVFLHSFRTGTSRALKAHSGSALALAFAPGMLATAGEDRLVRLWSDDGEPKATLQFPGNKVSVLAFSRDNRWLAAAAWDGSLVLWDGASLRPRLLPKSEFGIRSLAFAPDDRLFATSHQDGEVKLWRLDTGEVARHLVGHQLLASYVTFSRDGRRLASSGADGMVRLWDVATGERQILVGHGMHVSEVDFSPDGRSLVSAGIEDHAARIWDLASGASRLLPHEGLHHVHRARYSADGRFVLTAATDGVRVWRDDLPVEPDALRRWLEASTDLKPELTHRTP